LPEDVAPTELYLFSPQNYKYSAPTALNKEMRKIPALNFGAPEFVNDQLLFLHAREILGF